MKISKLMTATSLAAILAVPGAALAELAVNGKVVSGGSACTPRKGYICLESEGSPVEFRNLRIKELPSTNPKPDEIAKPAEK